MRGTTLKEKSLLSPFVRWNNWKAFSIPNTGSLLFEPFSMDGYFFFLT